MYENILCVDKRIPKKLIWFIHSVQIFTSTPCMLSANYIQHPFKLVQFFCKFYRPLTSLNSHQRHANSLWPRETTGQLGTLGGGSNLRGNGEKCNSNLNRSDPRNQNTVHKSSVLLPLHPKKLCAIQGISL